MRKEIIHMREEGHRTICSVSGHNIKMTDNVNEVTCKMCKSVLNKKQPEFTSSNREASSFRRDIL